MNEKIEAGRRVASHLLRDENAIDSAIVANAFLIIETVKAREVFQGGVDMNQKVLARLFRQGGHLVEARQEIAEAHAGFAQIRADEDLGGVGFGCQRPCLLGDQPPEQSHLRVAS